MDTDRLYLDFNATSPLSQSVLNWLKSGDLLFANPASQHSSGKASRKIINESRAKIFTTFGVLESEQKLFFHSGATEGIITFAYSLSEFTRSQGKELLICYSNLDHPAVTSLSERFLGEHVRFLKLNMDQSLGYAHRENLSLIQAEKLKNPELVILYHHLWVNNETGLVSPLKALMELKKISGLYVHVDAVQSPGKIADWRVLSLGDIFTFSAHKFGALKGIGFSFFDKNLPFTPFIMGGGQQSSLRSGTENPLGVQSVALALNDLVHVKPDETLLKLRDLENFLSEKLQGKGELVLSQGQERNSNTLYFYLYNHSSDIALALFDLNGLMISAGSACSSGAAKASSLMLHLGLEKHAKNGLRISLPFSLSDSELSEIKTRLALVLAKL